MIKSTFGITKEPFLRRDHNLLTQQKEIIDIITIHAQQGGFSVVVGQPGVGKSVLREHIEGFSKERDTVVISVSRTMHTYMNILKQLCDAFKINPKKTQVETELINEAYKPIKERKTLYILIDEAHLLDMLVLRKLRLLFDKFPKQHNLVLFGQSELFHQLSLTVNDDIKSRITYSKALIPLNDEDLESVIYHELDTVWLGHHTFNEAAAALILRSAQGNLRLCRNLCYGSLIEACRDGKKQVTTEHVNRILIQPHWRSHDELIKQQVATAS